MCLFVNLKRHKAIFYQTQLKHYDGNITNLDLLQNIQPLLKHPKYYKKFLHNFQYKKIKKSKFYKNKNLSKIDDTDVDKILVSKKESYGAKKSSKYFIEYNEDDLIRPLCIKLPQMIGYVKYFNSNKIMSFKASDNKLLKMYTKIWEKVSSLMDIKFDSEPVYGDNDKYIKKKVKIYGDRVNTNFQGKRK